jgi:hypothetical protein
LPRSTLATLEKTPKISKPFVIYELNGNVERSGK